MIFFPNKSNGKNPRIFIKLQKKSNDIKKKLNNISSIKICVIFIIENTLVLKRNSGLRQNTLNIAENNKETNLHKFCCIK